MSARFQNRRQFLRTASTGSAAAFAGGLAFTSSLPRVSAEDVVVKPDVVQFSDHIEPLVRLIEESPRERLLEQVAERIKHGRSYREVLAALLLAGIRNVQPYPSVGFKFHCVLVINACHLASISGPAHERWLPIFWALDYFKSSQADEARSSGWHMPAVHESLVPDATKAREMFVEAFDAWDVDKADAATTGLVRTAGATDVFNLFASYAARDFRSIGHKAIYLANSWRTLQVIGWQFAEPVLRSLASALLNHNGEPNPAQSDLEADRPWRESSEKIAAIPENWLSGKVDDAVPSELFQAFREETPNVAAATAVEALSRGVAPQSVWDGVFVGAGELLMRQPGIIGLHGLTTANAMHYLWQHVADDHLRRRLLLQACSFNAMFRDSAKSRGALGEQKIEDLQPLAGDASGNEALDEILSDISGNGMQAAQKLQSFLANGGSGYDFVDATRSLLFVKGRDAHDYKFSAAVLEDFGHVSPAWRDRFLALSVFNLKGTGHPDNALVKRTRSALQS
ncbi:MAG: hypothetical protein ABI614_02320 [Planctomycetota bacterium]